MRINDMARIAGVTLQTIRHYHRIGLIAEPARDANNYRRYDVNHLVRLLRIRRLTALGFPLSDVADLLDIDEGKARDALAALDRQLEAQMEQLARQRALIARLADSPGAPDVPIELAPFNAAFWDGHPADLKSGASDHAVLMAHLTSADELPLLVEHLERLTQPEVRATMIELSERYSRLDAHSTPAEVTALIDDYVRSFSTLFKDYPAPDSLNRPNAKRLVFGRALVGANANQQRVIEGIVRLL